MPRRLLALGLAIAAALGIVLAGRIGWVAFGLVAAAAGAVPVGDAFLAWARTRPVADSDSGVGGDTTPRPWWPLYLGASLLPAVLPATLALRRAAH